jgi:hypothetical protein
MLPALGAPAWAMRILVVAAIADLPVASTLAWIFEITPMGVRRTAPESEPGGGRSGPISRILVATGIAAVALLALLLGAAAGLAIRQGSGRATARREGRADRVPSRPSRPWPAWTTARTRSRGISVTT